jgi:hypothetical protein
MIESMDDVPQLVVGRPSGDYLTVSVLGRAHPGTDDYWDGNWLFSPITASLGSFTAQLYAQLRVDELQAFRHGLQRIDRDLQGEATLTSIEHWVSLTVACQSNGTLALTGELDDVLGPGNLLRFAMDDLDQTDLPNMISALETIEQAYPLLGQP